MKKYSVVIKKIEWIDKENPEAEIFFEINRKTFWAFCHPCDFIEGEIAEVNFSFIEDEVSEYTFWNENKEQKKELLQSKDNRWKYYCYGQLKSINPIVIDCGEITLSFEDWINDKRIIGNYVYFVISRFDIYRI